MENMEKTYILGNSQVLKELGGSFISIPALNTNEEYKVHDWLIPALDKNEIERVVIEIGKNPLLSLQIGYHIRLSIDDLKKKSLVPILFVSALSLNSIMLQTEMYSQILATKGVFFSEFELQSIQQEVEQITGLTESEYLTKFLKTIHVQPDETVGRHSLANIWGAYAMDKAANTNALPSDAKFKKTLYFKYISVFNNLDKLKPSPLKILGRISIGDMNNIEARDTRILLLDDEADKGWETVLRKVFKTTNDEDFVVINEKVKDYDALTDKSKRIIETEEFDLYLIDLRLNGLEEDENVNTEEFSGMKVLRKIKTLNEGNQVIIFTASNKVWNLKALLEAGADGYYMKESPEYNLSGKISKQNFTGFKQNVQKCFERSYLRDIYKDNQQLFLILNSISSSNFVNEIKNQLSLAYSLLNDASSDIQFAYAYISLYMIIEFINNEYYTKTSDDKWEILGIGNLLDWKWNTDSNTYSTADVEVIGNKPPEWQKFAGIYYQKWNMTDHNFIQQLYFLITKRNGFVHGDKLILDKQDKSGKFLNHDIYTNIGYEKLFKHIKTIIGYL